MRKKIWVTAKDVGGLNGVLPVYRLLRGRFDVRLFAEEYAANALTTIGEGFQLPQDAEAELQVGADPDLLLTSMDFGDHLGRDLVPLLRRTGTITVALQDYWGGQLMTGWQDTEFHPDYIVVNDLFGAGLVLTAWPDVMPERVRVCGFPALDKYAEVLRSLTSLNTEVRAELDIGIQEKIVLFAGQWWHSGRMLAEIVQALNANRQPVCLIARQHPGMVRNAPDQVPLWEDALANLQVGRVVPTESEKQITRLVAAADVVLGMYTTALVEACCLRKRNVSILYEDGGLVDFRRETGNLMPFPPVVSLLCSRMVQSQAQLQEALTDALDGRLDLSASQAEVFPNDGKNAERVADFITKLLA